jgi:hypothetical protein
MKKVVLLLTIMTALLLSACEKQDDYSYIYVYEVIELSNPDNTDGVTLENKLKTFRTKTENISWYESEYTEKPTSVFGYVVPGVTGVYGWEGIRWVEVRHNPSPNVSTDYMRR